MENVACERGRVLVVGSGIAGTCAALSAATSPSKPEVILASKGPLFSGSSFFEGTWGLGLVGPAGKNDEEDLVQTILRIGCGAANEELVRSFVAGISPTISQLEAWGVVLKRPSTDARDQRAYVPCFDHKHRSWHGIKREPFVNAMDNRLSESGVKVHSGWELLDFDPENRQAVFFDAGNECFRPVHYDALVLCTGGTGSLFSRHLTQDDCCATVQGLAAARGCRLTNMAFMQFMPGIVSPVQNVVFNEKTFRYMQLPSSAIDALGGTENANRLLETRSGYGPFTCRLNSCTIDLAIHGAGPEGMELVPRFPTEHVPEFVTTYQQWLQNAAGIEAADTLRIAMYAHANNGGLAIDTCGRTNIEGVFAAGECTGGMHGADRLGGLSSANGLVFGTRAGTNAASFAARNQRRPPTEKLPGWTALASHLSEEIGARLTAVMDRSCMIIRKRSQVEEAQNQLDALSEQLRQSLAPTTTSANAATTRTTQLRLATAQAIVSAIRGERKSRGSHYWGDNTD